MDKDFDKSAFGMDERLEKIEKGNKIIIAKLKKVESDNKLFKEQLAVSGFQEQILDINNKIESLEDSFLKTKRRVALLEIDAFSLTIAQNAKGKLGPTALSKLAEFVKFQRASAMKEVELSDAPLTTSSNFQFEIAKHCEKNKLDIF